MNEVCPRAGHRGLTRGAPCGCPRKGLRVRTRFLQKSSILFCRFGFCIPYLDTMATLDCFVFSFYKCLNWLYLGIFFSFSKIFKCILIFTKKNVIMELLTLHNNILKGVFPFMHSHCNISDELLQDFFQNGREAPWRAKKMQNEYLSMAYQKINPAKSQRLLECSTQLVFRKYETGERKLHSMNSCRVRLCPLCTWRRSLKTYSNNMRIVDYIHKNDKLYSYILLTLTVRNCKGDKLCKTIDELLYGFKLFSKTVPFKKCVVGWFRGLEVTHNVDPLSKSYDTYHPHIHVLLCVQPSYFTSRYYMSQKAWTDLWKRSLGIDYVPTVDVRKIKNVRDSRAVAEVSKYPVKDSEIIVYDDWDLTEDAVSVLDEALANRRLLAYGGKLKEVKNLLKLEDEETGSLVNIDGEATVPDGKFILEFYAWHTGYRQYIKGEL